jgi:hypothetical protein
MQMKLRRCAGTPCSKIAPLAKCFASLKDGYNFMKAWPGTLKAAICNAEPLLSFIHTGMLLGKQRLRERSDAASVCIAVSHSP